MSSETAARRRAWENESAGPLWAAVVMTPFEQPFPVFGVKPGPTWAAVTGVEEGTYEGGFVAIKESDVLMAEYLTFVLELDWSDPPGQRMVLVFPFSEYKDALLLMVKNGGVCALATKPGSIEDMLMVSGIPTEIVLQAFAALLEVQ
jgi:hypothetical protein